MLKLLFLLLPIAAISGWFAGYRHKSKPIVTSKAANKLPKDYFIGLNYLINEQPDKAVDIFIKMLAVDSDTVETHLTLGNLFRRRGEVDRAIRIHQNVMARPQLAKSQRARALLELGQDYMRAGVLNRAERLFSELVDMDEEVTTGLGHLLAIYQTQKDWQQAITIAERLERESNTAMQRPIAYFYCELADQHRQQNDVWQAQHYLQKAFAIDSDCVRASIMTGDIEAQSGKHKVAIKSYKRVLDQDHDFLSEIVDPLEKCYSELNQEPEYIKFLRNCLDEYPRVSVVLALGEYLRKHQGDFAAIEFLAEQMHRYPSLRMLNHLINLYLNNSEGNTRDKLLLLRGLTDKLLAEKPIYRCNDCGFSGKQLYWQCPSCRNWGLVKPIHGLEGD